MVIAAVLDGAVAMACAAIGGVFLRFWPESRERLFVCLIAGFWMLGINYALLGAMAAAEAQRPSVLLLRLIGFIAILVGVFLKDRELVDHLRLPDVEN